MGMDMGIRVSTTTMGAFRKKLEKLPTAMAKSQNDAAVRQGVSHSITTNTGNTLPFPILDTFNHAESRSYQHMKRPGKSKNIGDVADL